MEAVNTGCRTTYQHQVKFLALRLAHIYLWHDRDLLLIFELQLQARGRQSITGSTSDRVQDLETVRTDQTEDVDSIYFLSTTWGKRLQ